MKKSLIFILTIFAAGFIFAQEAESVTSSEQTENTVAETQKTAPTENEIALEYANYLFEDGFIKGNNAKKIGELTPFLTAEQRENLYEENERLGVKPFLLNLLLGFGIGSFSQGDRAIGRLQFWGDILGYGMMIPGMILVMDATKDLDTTVGTALVTIGSLVTLGVAIPAYIRPWTFAANRNEKLRRALQVDENGKAVSLSNKAENSVEVSFAPIISPVTSEYGLMARIAF